MNVSLVRWLRKTSYKKIDNQHLYKFQIRENDYDNLFVNTYNFVYNILTIIILLAQRLITLVLMMTNSCSYSTNDLAVFKFQILIKILVGV